MINLNTPQFISSKSFDDEKISIDIVPESKDSLRNNPILKNSLNSPSKNRINAGNIIKSLRKALLLSKSSPLQDGTRRVPQDSNGFISPEQSTQSMTEEQIDILSWTDEMEDEILNLSETCFEDSDSINIKANFYIKYGKILQVCLIVLGVSSVYISSSSIPTVVKDNMNVVLGASSAILSSIYTLLSFSKKGIKLKEISYDLGNLSRLIRCELFKPVTRRDNITNFLIFIQTTRDKLLKKVDID